MIQAFQATKPNLKKVRVEDLVTPATDYLSKDKLQDLYSYEGWNYIHVLSPNINLTVDDLSRNFSKYQIFRSSSDYFKRMKEEEIIIRDTTSHIYLYRIQSGEHEQLGFMAVSKIENLLNDKIRGHELTYPEKAELRADQMSSLNTQIGPIYVTYPDVPSLEEFMAEKATVEPDYDFVCSHQDRHTLWCLGEEATQEFLKLCGVIEQMYIADGHHRSTAITQIYKSRPEVDKFMIAAFPKSQMKVYDYNRAVKDLNHLSLEKFLEDLKENFICEPCEKPVKPNKPGIFGMYHKGQWYRLEFIGKAGDDVLSRLDINIIDHFCLKPFLGVKDVNDDRIRYIVGYHGLKALEKKVDDNPNSIAFSIHPVSIDDVCEIADKHLTTPPKTTCFEPKPLDGLLVYEF